MCDGELHIAWPRFLAGKRPNLRSPAGAPGKSGTQLHVLTTRARDYEFGVRYSVPDAFI
jgi:hypothetical protein